MACDDVVMTPSGTIQVPQMETLVLHWDFSNVTGSGNSSDGLPTTSDAKFIVNDISSGSVGLKSRYSWFGPVRYSTYPGRGDFYLPFDTSSINREYIASAKQMPPEVINGSNLVQVLEDEDRTFTRESQPVKHFFSVEKGPYSVINNEILKIFGTISDFNNLIGEPVNRYRQTYKALDKLRSQYFERINNDIIDYEKFVDYFKWLDNSISQVLQQLIPASAKFSDNVRNVVESHVLERNKYWSKFSNFKFGSNILEGHIQVINDPLSERQYTLPRLSGTAPFDRFPKLSKIAPFQSVDALLPKFQAYCPQYNEPKIIRIQNIQNSKASSSYSASLNGAYVPLGNYRSTYEIIQTSGRIRNNRYFVKTAGTGTFVLNGPVSGSIPVYTLNNRSRGNNKWIIQELFSAPGEKRTLSRGWLDPLSEEYSVYNNINYRNQDIRNVLNTNLQLHAGFGGMNPTASIIPTYQKNNRNQYKFLSYSAVSSSYYTASSFDNGFITKPIPQSDIQYHWLTASIDIVNNTVLGYVSNFYVNSGSSSVTASQITTITGSSIWNNGMFVDFIGLNYLVYDPITASNNILSSSNNNYINTAFGTLSTPNILNSLLLHRNGPYQHPSWKQIRMRDGHPLVRYFNNNNIISIIDAPQQLTMFGSDGNRTIYNNKRPDGFTNYNEPPVSFKYKPIIHTFNITGSNLPVSFRHAYGNNISMFSNIEINNKLGLSLCREQIYDRLKDLYIGTDLDEKTNPIKELKNISYSETIWPKEVNTTFSKVRSRQNYAESAPRSSSIVSSFYDVFQTQIGSAYDLPDYTSNGIDRIPTQRRTFWRKTARNRNRWGLIDLPASDGLTYLDFSGSLKTPLLNSQGIRDGETPSIWPFGMLLSHTQSAEGVSDSNSTIMASYTNLDFGELSPMRGLIGLGYSTFAAAGNAEWGYHTDWSYFQKRSSTVYGTGSNTAQLGRYFYQNPTCSALYTKQVYPDHLIFGSNAHVITNGALFTEYQDDFNHRFRVPAFAGKDPWFDSYDEFSQDIKLIGKEYSIIPEFNMSNNMEYYINKNGGNFRSQNDKFLTNAGATITQSATDEKGGFDSNFFATYAHSDLMKYFDNIVSDHNVFELGVDKISLSFKGIKKLLPYNGFYPVSRTLQLATLFSQSYGPYIGGYAWKDGKSTDKANATIPSGNLAVAALLQPFFAPGILYNTIKSGIAMDFPVFTGSAAGATNAGASSVVITSSLNYRIQFESIVDIKNGSGLGGVPVSSSDGTKKIYFQGVEYLGSSDITNGVRDVYFDWNGGETSPIYRLAAQNFLGESINFFLKDNSLKTKVSQPANKMKNMVSGNTYYMDVRLNRSDDLLMYGGRWNNTNKLFHTASFTGPGGGVLCPDYAALTYTGKFFGHPFAFANESLYSSGIAAFGNASATNSHLRTLLYSDFAYAPYLPPYYFKDNIARLSYTSDGAEKNQTDPISYVLSKVKVNNINNTLKNGMLFYNDNISSKVLSTPSWIGQSTVSSSVNLFGVSKGFKTTFDPTSINNIFGKATPKTIEESDATFNSWVISPKFECPIMNFKTQPDEKYTVVFEDGDFLGTPSSQTSGNMSFVPKGMWSGYGDFCTGSTGVFLSVEESFPDLDPSLKILSGSLIDIFGFNTDPLRLGELADFKEISEAIVAIPFVDNQTTLEGFAKTTNIMGKHFFQIEPNVYKTQKTRKEGGLPVVNAGEYGIKSDLAQTSITEMIDKMSQYVIPPELNFLKYNDIAPFVMYIFEVKHLLDKQDLADIWQGVMPKIALTAEKTETTITHNNRPWEFFGGKKIPPKVRWMIFKVKKQAVMNYFSKTNDSKNDNRFKFDFKIGNKEPEYSFSWPYDYFSLVELGKMDVQIDIASPPIIGELLPSQTGLSPIVKKDIFGNKK